MGSVHRALATNGGLLHLVQQTGVICSPHMPNDYSFLCTSLYHRTEKKDLDQRQTIAIFDHCHLRNNGKTKPQLPQNVKVKHTIYPF